MSEIEVDPALLRATGRRLVAAVDVARDVRREGGALRGLAAGAGHERLAEAVDTFVARWSHGIGCLVDDAETLAAMLLEAGTTYLEVESTISGACEPAG